MPLFPKTRFTWFEPKAFYRAEVATEKAMAMWWLKPGLTVMTATIFFVMMLPVQWMKRHYHLHGWEDIPSAPVNFLLSLLLGAFLVYVVPWLRRSLPSQIKVADHGIWRANYNRLLKFEDFRFFFWEQSPEFATLVLVRRKGGRVSIGAPLDLRQDEVSTWLCSRGLRNEIPP